MVVDRVAWFKINRVDCQLNHYVCPLNLEPILLSFLDKNIFRFDSGSAANQMMAFDPTLTDIKVKKRLPNILEIRLERRLPVAAIKIADKIEFSGFDSSDSASLAVNLTDRLFYIDKTGFVYRPTVVVSQALPQIDWPDSLPIIEGESTPMANLAMLINTLAAYYVNFSEIARLGEKAVYVVATSEGPLAIIPDGNGFVQPVASLQFILTNIKIGERIPKKIDLRFDKPVLTY